MLLQVNYYGNDQVYIINTDNILSITKDPDTAYTTIRFNLSEVDGSTKKMWVTQTLQELTYALSHFMLKPLPRG